MTGLLALKILPGAVCKPAPQVVTLQLGELSKRSPVLPLALACKSVSSQAVALLPGALSKVSLVLPLALTDKPLRELSLSGTGCLIDKGQAFFPCWAFG